MKVLTKFAKTSFAVLVAEDEPVILTLIEDVLQDGGFMILSACDGGQAISFLRDQRWNILAVVTDIRMGAGPDGWEVARHARGLNPRIPVIYMSGDSAMDWSVQGVPGSLMIQKPFAPAQILTAVASLINAYDA